LHTAHLMPLPLTVSCFSKIQIGFTFIVPAYPGSPGKRAIKRVCVSVTVIQQFCATCVDRNLEQIVKAHQSKPQHGQNQLSDETKFKVVSVLFLLSYLLPLRNCVTAMPHLAHRQLTLLGPEYYCMLNMH